MLISVIIPFHEYTHLTDRCITSIVPQLNSSSELILVGDGVSEIDCQQVVQNHPTITVLRLQKVGANSAREHGILQARGRYILMADSDDELCVDALTVYTHIIVKESPDLIISNVNRINSSNGKKEPFYSFKRAEKKIPKEELSSSELYNLPVLICKCIRKACIAGISLDNSSMYQDFNMTGKIFKTIQNLYYTNRITYNYYTRQYSTSSSASNTPEKILQALPSMDGILSFYTSHNLSTVEKHYLNLSLVRFSFSLIERARFSSDPTLSDKLRLYFRKNMSFNKTLSLLIMPKALVMALIVRNSSFLKLYSLFKAIRLEF